MHAAFLIGFRSSDSQIARGQSDTVNAVRGVTEKPNHSLRPNDDPVGPLLAIFGDSVTTPSVVIFATLLLLNSVNKGFLP
jgi:hypothetical protein